MGLIRKAQPKDLARIAEIQIFNFRLYFYPIFLNDGYYLAQTDLVKMLSRSVLYKISALRLLVIPAISLLVLSLIPASMQEMRTVLMIVAACPVGSNVAVYAQLHGKDYPYAVETVVISTILSILTIPLMMYLSSLIWR